MESDYISHIEIPADFTIRPEAFRELEARIDGAGVALREALAGFSPDVDPHQRRVIEDGARTIRLVAPAGSGKTQTIIHRATQRIRDGVNPSRILILTFDNAAASSLSAMLRRQSDQLAVPLNNLRITTLNAFGYSLLRDYAKPEYRPILEDRRAYALVRELRQALRQKSSQHGEVLTYDIANRFLLEYFGLLKNELFDPRSTDAQKFADFVIKAKQSEPLFAQQRGEQATRSVIEALLWLFRAYERTLHREGRMDFDDQKLRPFVLLQSDTSLLQRVQSLFSEVVVDEFQDINRLDFELIKATAGAATLVVTGDDDQAIYGFRGCSPEFIINLERHLERPHESHELRINYRCPANLVDHANRLIRHNAWRIEKNPVPNNPIHSTIHVVSSQTAGLEARAVVRWIKRIRRTSPDLSYHDLAVLYRTNAQSLPLQVEFILNDIPYYVRKEDNLLANDSLDRLLGVLRVKLAAERGENPQPEDAVRSVRAYFRFIQPRVASSLEPYFRSRHDFRSAVSSSAFFRLLPKAEASQFGDAMEELLRTTGLAGSLDVLAKRFAGLRGMIGSLEDVVQDRVPLGEVYELAASFKGNLRDFVQTVQEALDRARASKAGEAQENGVALLTYFRAKGRQWHTVILTTCNDGLIPHRRAPMEDERRLFYVAMTRASANLIVSYVKKSCNHKVAPSPFLREAGLLPP